jgi:hypothetical protein
VNPVVAANDDHEATRPFKKATTYVKNRTWGAKSVVSDCDDDVAPLNTPKRASTSVKKALEQKVPHQGQQYSISRCLEVLRGMDDVSDEIKVLASDVLKDAASREFFLCISQKKRILSVLRIEAPWFVVEGGGG